MGPRYRIIRKLGEGSYGVVFEAEHVRLKRVVALKRLNPEARRRPTIVERFYREAEVCAKLDHPSIVRVLDTDEDADGPLIAFELFRGISLAKLIETNGRLSPHDAVIVAARTLAGLASAHQAGVLHRDIKPANILVSDDTSSRFDLVDGRAVKIIDFGVAKETFRKSLTGLTRPGEIVGSLAYMAPEQMHNRGPDHRADLYALAVCTYAALSGRRPFDAQTIPDLLRQLESDPTPLNVLVPTVSVEIANVVHRGLERDPSRRFDSAEEMRGALLDALAHTSTKQGKPRLAVLEATVTVPHVPHERVEGQATETLREKAEQGLLNASSFGGANPFDLTSDAVTAVDSAKRLLQLAAPHLQQKEAVTDAEVVHDTYDANQVTEKLYPLSAVAPVSSTVQPPPSPPMAVFPSQVANSNSGNQSAALVASPHITPRRRGGGTKLVLWGGIVAVVLSGVAYLYLFANR